MNPLNMFSSSGALGLGKNLTSTASGAASNAATMAGTSAVANNASNSVGSTLDKIGGSDVSTTGTSLNGAVQDAQAMTEMQMQASSAMAKMNMMASINDGLNSVMKKAGESFKSAAQ
jgi:hypothetical protein